MLWKRSENHQTKEEGQVSENHRRSIRWRAGYAWHFKKYSSDKEYDKIETEARENKRGLWQDKNPVAPWTWREIKKQKRALKKVLLFDCI